MLDNREAAIVRPDTGPNSRMILLPDRYADFRSPSAVAQHSEPQIVLPTEEHASLWISVRPRLLGWHRPISWLPPQVLNARRKTKRDLCGLDSEGNLIIVETKLDRGKSSRDPIGSLLEYSRHNAKDHAWSAKELRAKWVGCLASQKTFLENEIAMLWSTEPNAATFTGIVPYALDRYPVWRYRSLYCAIVARAISDERYERAIDQALRFREAAGDPPPVFASLVASTSNDFQLSSEGRRNLQLLQKHASLPA